MVETKLPNHIQEYLDQKGEGSEFLELFEAKYDDVDLKTDVTHPELTLLNAIIFNHMFLLRHKIPSPYFKFVNQYMRLKVSMDRKSRAEFVDINKRERFENNLDKFNSFQNLKKVKE